MNHDIQRIDGPTRPEVISMEMPWFLKYPDIKQWQSPIYILKTQQRPRLECGSPVAKTIQAVVFEWKSGPSRHQHGLCDLLLLLTHTIA